MAFFSFAKIFSVLFQVVHAIVDDLGDGLGPVGKNGGGEDWWYEDRQVKVTQYRNECTCFGQLVMNHIS